MSNPDAPITRIGSSRRNLIRAGGIAVAALLSRGAKPARAGRGYDDDGGDDDGHHHHCFLKGTTITTIWGPRRVEALVAGDLLPCDFGGARRIEWIGRYHYKKADPSRAWVRDVRPVRIARSALGRGVPHRDLCLSTGHALLIDGVLVPAGSLINGTTITLDEARGLDTLEYFHIKLATHDVIYAEGAPCETLLHVDDAAVNFAEYFRSYGTTFADATPCAPLLSFNGGRSEVKSRLRSALAPWIDRRNQLDIIRDRLEARGLAMLRQFTRTGRLSSARPAEFL